MGTKTYDSATDMITFSRASGGTALRRVGYGPELVTNGDFATDSDWTLANAVISGGVVAATNGTRFLAQNAGLVTGKLYTVTLDFTQGSTGNAGKIRVNTTATNGGGTEHVSGNFSSIGSSGSLTYVLKAEGPYIAIEAALATFSGTIDNVSVKEVIFDVATDPLVLFNHPDNIPRIEYDAAGAVKGLLIEEARTNLLTYSEDFSNAAWNIQSTSIESPVANSATAPDGSFTANTLQELSSGSEGPRIYPSYRTVTANQQITYSAFMKKGTANYGYLCARHSAGNVAGAEFDLNAGTVDSTINAGNYTLNASSITDVGDGWYLCSIVATCTASTATGFYFMGIGNGTGVSSAGYPIYTLSGKTTYAWGAQLEVGGFGSSYIPTTAGATATRAADLASIPTSAFGYNAEGGTVVVDFNMSFGGTNYPRAWELGSTIDSNDRINVFGYAPTAIIGTGLFTAGVGQGGTTLSTGNTVPTGQIKAAFAWRENDLATVQDGGTVQTDSVATITGGNPRTQLALGKPASSSSGSYLNGHIKSIQYYPRRLSNAQLQELTT